MSPTKSKRSEVEDVGGGGGGAKHKLGTGGEESGGP